jgi:hypothetical protein
MELWNRSAQTTPDARKPWLAGKIPHYSPDELDSLGISRWLPQKDLPEWWPWRYPFLACLAFDHRGLIQSIHARVATKVEPGKPKSRFPKGYSASGLVIGNKTATNWLRGKFKTPAVVIAEGITSMLACSMALRRLGRWNWAVLGYISGSHSAIKEMPWSTEQCYVFTDSDSAGEEYANRITQALPVHIQPKRVRL